MNTYTIIFIISLILFIAFQVALAIYFEPSRVIARWEKKQAERSRKLHLEKSQTKS